MRSSTYRDYQSKRKLRRSSRKRIILVIGSIVLSLLACALHVRGYDPDPNESASGPVVGIDLGTKNSRIAIQRDGRVDIIPNEHGDLMTPSYAAFLGDGERVVGVDSKSRTITDPLNTIHDMKRIIGLLPTDPNAQKSLKNFVFKWISRVGRALVEIVSPRSPKDFTLERILATILSLLKESAERYLDESVSQAVIAVPVWFNDAQREAMREAGRIAGLHVRGLINKPTAAALAYGLDSEKLSDEHFFVVYDLGGGAFDVTVVEQDSGVFEVLAAGGDTHLGGDYFDNRIIDLLVPRWNVLHPLLDVTNDKTTRARLHDAVEAAKRLLSEPGITSAAIRIPEFKDGTDFSTVLTRAEFNAVNEDLFQRTLEILSSVINDSTLERSTVEDIILIGGSTRIPRIRELLQDYFPGKPLRTQLDPLEAVVMGAAKMAAIFMGEEDELVGNFDINPLSLGIDASGFMIPFVIRNTIIPTKRSKMFTTVKDNQRSVTIRVLEGERAKASENYYLGEFTLPGIIPYPRGVPQIEVTFQIDQNGVLNVTAADNTMGQTVSAEFFTQLSRSSYEKVERMLEEAEMYLEQDRDLRTRMEASWDLESNTGGIIPSPKAPSTIVDIHEEL
ncbi:heat shock 70 kDa protein [Ascodesmis nigricans]|uniref:Heat shock 70 kDa protein n=1 Tax=Ascodesmis nigricans TaxID=341454 RepID=A0A4S2MVE7_9PEZI|nr:heat shock 70 kDa protein [Ascodesmis nigricans]